MDFLNKYTSQIHGILRIVVGLLFLEHGTAKLLHFPLVPMFDHVQIGSLVGVSGVIELVAGVLIVAGLFSRFAAFIASGEMAAAYFLVHYPLNALGTASPFPVLNGGELAIVYSFVFLYLAAAGPGAFAVNQK